jgi:hypothetical protein
LGVYESERASSADRATGFEVCTPCRSHLRAEVQRGRIGAVAEQGHEVVGVSDHLLLPSLALPPPGEEGGNMGAPEKTLALAIALGLAPQSCAAISRTSALSPSPQHVLESSKQFVRRFRREPIDEEAGGAVDEK